MAIITIEMALVANFCFQLDVKASLELEITCESHEQTLMLNTPGRRQLMSWAPLVLGLVVLSVVKVL